MENIPFHFHRSKNDHPVNWQYNTIHFVLHIFEWLFSLFCFVLVAIARQSAMNIHIDNNNCEHSTESGSTFSALPSFYWATIYGQCVHICLSNILNIIICPRRERFSFALSFFAELFASDTKKRSETSREKIHFFLFSQHVIGIVFVIRGIAFRWRIPKDSWTREQKVKKHNSAECVCIIITHMCIERVSL